MSTFFVVFRFLDKFQGLISTAVTRQLAVTYLGQFLFENLEFRLKYPENTCFLSVQPQNALLLASSFTFFIPYVA